MNRRDYTGQTFGRLTILRDVEDAPTISGPTRMVECECSCGAVTVKRLYTITAGGTASCGCLAKELSSDRLRTHGASTSPTYQVWASMKKRGRGGRDRKRYFDRGIRVCKRWDESFTNFLVDMGERPSAGHSIERKDNDGDYSPENCVWATIKTQNRNKSTTRYVEVNGCREKLADLADEHGVSVRNLRARIRIGWPLAKALETPVAFMAPRKSKIK